MQEDAEGFYYPLVDEKKCIGCRKCINACNFQTGAFSDGAWSCFAASSIDGAPRSASGGVFASLANTIIDRGGAVAGCCYLICDGVLTPRHVLVTSKDELSVLLGSKYVQSEASAVFVDVRSMLSDNREVLFCGTPCQVAGLYGYLGGHPEGLYTIDLVCHGVPSAALLQGYIAELEKREHAHIVDMQFRSKFKGWGPLLLAFGLERDGERYTKYAPADESSYYSLFLALDTLRPSCYECPFASKRRPADITIGDFWGVEETHPELIEENSGVFKPSSGVSCVLVNNANGQKLLNLGEDTLISRAVSFESIASKNDQLRTPGVRKPSRDRVYQTFARGGYGAVERAWRLRMLPAHLLRAIVQLIPEAIKRPLRQLLTR